jgi:acetoin utilization protein AcuB
MQSRCPQCGLTLPQGTPAWIRQITVGQLMTPNPVTLSPEDSLATAVQTLRRHHVRRIPIVLAGELVGIVAEGDLKRASPSTLSDSPEEYERVMEGTPISRIMVARPITTVESALLVEAVHTLQTTKFGSLPVLRDGHLVGILTDNDVLRFLHDLLDQSG